MERPFDLEAYCARIGYTGPRAPTRDSLAAVLAGHVANIPFENFDVLLRRPIRLDPAGLQAKLVTARRGGYCFEHGGLLSAALEAMGFAPVRHSSRVVLFQPRQESVRQHLFLTVSIDGETYLLDPGFGAFACPVLIPLDGTPVPAAAPTHRLVQDGSVWTLLVHRDGEEVPGWVSSLEPEYPIDAEMMNHFIATHPTSFFVQNIMASAAIPGGRVSIMSSGVTLRRDGVTEASVLPDRAALRALVAQHFGFDLAALETMPVSAVPGWD